MKIEKGMVRQICFYPSEDVEIAFEKAEGAESKTEADELATLYAYAKKGAGVTT